MEQPPTILTVLQFTPAWHYQFFSLIPAARRIQKYQPERGLLSVPTSTKWYSVPVCRSDPRSHLPAEVEGARLWTKFYNKVLLTQQMRQAKDRDYDALLVRARNGELTEADYRALMSRLPTEIDVNE
ncbi:hypothetical protein RUND412_005878, partial [Rhizina undulata]